MCTTITMSVPITFKNYKQYKRASIYMEKHMSYYQTGLVDAELSVSYTHGHFTPGKPFNVTMNIHVTETTDNSIWIYSQVKDIKVTAECIKEDMKKVIKW